MVFSAAGKESVFISFEDFIKNPELHFEGLQTAFEGTSPQLTIKLNEKVANKFNKLIETESRQDQLIDYEQPIKVFNQQDINTQQSYTNKRSSKSLFEELEVFLLVGIGVLFLLYSKKFLEVLMSYDLNLLDRIESLSIFNIPQELQDIEGSTDTESLESETVTDNLEIDIVTVTVTENPGVINNPIEQKSESFLGSFLKERRTKMGLDDKSDSDTDSEDEEIFETPKPPHQTKRSEPQESVASSFEKITFTANPNFKSINPEANVILARQVRDRAGNLTFKFRIKGKDDITITFKELGIESADQKKLSLPMATQPGFESSKKQNEEYLTTNKEKIINMIKNAQTKQSESQRQKNEQMEIQKKVARDTRSAPKVSIQDLLGTIATQSKSSKIQEQSNPKTKETIISSLGDPQKRQIKAELLWLQLFEKCGVFKKLESTNIQSLSFDILGGKDYAMGLHNDHLYYIFQGRGKSIKSNEIIINDENREIFQQVKTIFENLPDDTREISGEEKSIIATLVTGWQKPEVKQTKEELQGISSEDKQASKNALTASPDEKNKLKSQIIALRSHCQELDLNHPLRRFLAATDSESQKPLITSNTDFSNLQAIEENIQQLYAIIRYEDKELSKRLLNIQKELYQLLTDKFEIKDKNNGYDSNFIPVGVRILEEMTSLLTAPRSTNRPSFLDSIQKKDVNEKNIQSSEEQSSSQLEKPKLNFLGQLSMFKKPDEESTEKTSLDNGKKPQ